jgi:putative Mn2+ efflux pump MntP
MLTSANLALAISLSADAFVASLAKGAQFPRLPVLRSLAIASGFALLEALMPLAGWMIGEAVGPWLAAVDHWVAFCLLGFLGLRMIVSGLTETKVDRDAMPTPGWLAIAAVACGTSLDGLAAGMTFALVVERILPLLAAIAVVTFLLVWLGLRVGHIAGSRLGRVVQVLGGLTLVAVGSNILLEHLSAG